MAVPKRKTGRARTRRRRARGWVVPAPPLAECPQCHQAHRPHTVCPHCGWYAGRQAVEPNI